MVLVDKPVARLFQWQNLVNPEKTEQQGDYGKRTDFFDDVYRVGGIRFYAPPCCGGRPSKIDELPAEYVKETVFHPFGKQSCPQFAYPELRGYPKG